MTDRSDPLHRAYCREAVAGAIERAQPETAARLRELNGPFVPVKVEPVRDASGKLSLKGVPSAMETAAETWKGR